MAHTTSSDRRHGVPSVLAQFPDLASARATILALESSGIDGDAISLVGARAEAARQSSSRSVADRRMLFFLLSRTIVGVLIGVVIGAVSVGVLGLIVAAISDMDVGAVAAACAIGGGLLGGTLGAFISVERSAGFSESWPLTFQDIPDGPVWLAVHGRHGHSTEVLEAHHALAIRHPKNAREVEQALRD